MAAAVPTVLGQVEAHPGAVLGEPRPDASDDRDLEAVEDPDRAEADDDQPVKARPGQPVQARRNGTLDNGAVGACLAWAACFPRSQNRKRAPRGGRGPAPRGRRGPAPRGRRNPPSAGLWTRSAEGSRLRFGASRLDHTRSRQPADRSAGHPTIDRVMSARRSAENPSAENPVDGAGGPMSTADGPPAGVTFERSYAAVPASAGAVRAALARFARRQRLADATIDAATLAVSEAVTNVVVHAYTDRTAGSRLQASLSRRWPGPSSGSSSRIRVPAFSRVATARGSGWVWRSLRAWPTAWISSRRRAAVSRIRMRFAVTGRAGRRS